MRSWILQLAFVLGACSFGAWADPTQFYNQSFVLPAGITIVNQDGERVQLPIDTNMVIEDHSMQNGELVYQFRQLRREGRYFLRADILKEIPGLEDCDNLPISSNLRNLMTTQRALMSMTPTYNRDRMMSINELPEDRPLDMATPGGLAEQMAEAAYQVAGLCTNNSNNYRDLNYVKKRIAREENCRSRAGGKCYGAVKAALRVAGATDHHLDGVSAASAHTSGTLRKAGFRQIDCTSDTAPVGAILVFNGGRYGHIEINSGVHGYCSDFCRSEPIDKYAKRTLIGCYVK